MFQPARARGHRFLLVVLFAINATAGFPRTSFSQQQQGMELALDLLEKLEYTRAGADAITASMSLVEFEQHYCLPPDPPSKATEEQFLKAREASLVEYRRRYNSLRIELDNLMRRDGRARMAIDQKFDGNAVDNQSWAPWLQAFARAAKAIGDKRKQLASIPVVRCRDPEPQQPPADPPPPSGPGIELPEPTVRPVAYPTFKVPFCSESDKQSVIQQFRAVAWDYYMNYQDARVYHDAIREALDQGRGNASVLRSLLTGARASLDLHTKALDDFNKELDRVRALPVIDCGQQPQTVPDEIPPLLFDPFVFPAVPAEFCTPEAKDETVRQLDAARRAALRNYDKAAARITALGDRIARGDSSTTTSAAFQEANEAASAWLQQSRALEADMQRAAAMPVVECAPPAQPSVPAEYGFGSGIKIGYTVAPAYFSHFTEIVGDRPGVTGYSADDSPVLSGPFLEFNLTSRLRFGASALFGKQRFTQDYSSAQTTGLVKSTFADSRLSYVLPIGSLDMLVGGGITWTRNELTDVHHVNHATESLPGKSVSGFMSNLGAAIDFPLPGRFGGRVGTDFITSFKRPNADEHYRTRLTVHYNPS